MIKVIPKLENKIKNIKAEKKKTNMDKNNNIQGKVKSNKYQFETGPIVSLKPENNLLNKEIYVYQNPYLNIFQNNTKNKEIPKETEDKKDEHHKMRMEEVSRQKNKDVPTDINILEEEDKKINLIGFFNLHV